MSNLYSLDGKKIWVAGHSGMVGSAVCRALKDRDIELLTVPHAELDLTKQADTLSWIYKNKPDVIVMAAAKVGGIVANKSHQADFLYENLAMTQNVIHSAHLVGVEKLLYLGSSCIYPKQEKQPIEESDLMTGALEPTNEGYAVAKIAGLKMCEMYRQQYRRDYIAAMPCNLYGVGDRYSAQGSHVLPALIMKFHEAVQEGYDEVVLWGSGTPLREFLYVDDLAKACITLLEQYSDGAHINVGHGEEVSIRALGDIVARTVGFKGRITFDANMPDGMMRKVMDSSRMRALGWQPETPLEQGIQLAYEDYCRRFVNPL